MNNLFDWRLTIKPIWSSYEPGIGREMLNLKDYVKSKIKSHKCNKCKLKKSEVLVVLKKGRYVWKDEGRVYKEWWLDYTHHHAHDHDEYKKDILGGRDCIIKDTFTAITDDRLDRDHKLGCLILHEF